jgi:hypothetical protein
MMNSFDNIMVNPRQLTIPKDEAQRLCDEVYIHNLPKWYSYGHWWCWGCRKFSKSPDQRCAFNSPEGTNRGCAQINEVFDKQLPYHIIGEKEDRLAR